MVIRPKLISYLAALSVILIAFLTYRDITSYYFTGMDTLTIIERSRILSGEDLMRIITRPFLDGSDMGPLLNYYRPIQMLSFSLDYSLWKLNPFGYHLTDLILHMLLALFVYLFLNRLSRGSRTVSWLGAILFAIHPVLVENVPAPARRDVHLSSLFLLISFLFFMAYREKSRHRILWSGASLFFFALALYTKESAVLLPFILSGYVLICGKVGEGTGGRLKSVIPHFVLLVPLLAWRAFVLKGAGSTETLFSAGLVDLTVYNRIVIQFFLHLVCLKKYFATAMEDLLKVLRLVTPLIAWGFIGTTTFILGFILFRRIGEERWPVISLKAVLAAMLLLSLTGILAYPWVFQPLNRMIEAAYRGEGPESIEKIMQADKQFRIGTNSGLDGYKELARWIVVSFLVIKGFMILMCLIVVHNWHAIRRSLAGSVLSRIAALALIWIFMVLGLYTMVKNFSCRNLCIAVIPLSALLSVSMVGGVRTLIRGCGARGESKETDRRGRRRAVAGGLLLTLVSGGLGTYFFALSPLVREYVQWKDSGDVTALFFDELSKGIDDLPEGGVLVIHGLPSAIHDKNESLRVDSVCFPIHAGIKAWLDMKRPGNGVTVKTRKQRLLKDKPQGIELVWKDRSKKAGKEVFIEYKY